MLAIVTVIALFWWRRRRVGRGRVAPEGRAQLTLTLDLLARQNRDIRQVEAIRRATLKAEQAGFHLGAAGPGTGNGEGFGVPVERGAGAGTRSPSLNARERGADGASARFPREAGARGSFDALTFGSGTAEWSHLQRSPHGTLGQAGAAGEGGHAPGELGALGMTSRTYSGRSINLDLADPSNRDGDRLLDPAAAGRDTSPTASFRLELERDRRRDADGLNPFSDQQSIATDALSFGSTNVIPIAFVPPSQPGGGATTDTRAGKSSAADSAMALDAARRELAALRGGHPVGPPTRPNRSPDLDLRLTHAAAPGRLPDTGLEFLGNAYADPHNDARQSFQTSRTAASIAPSFFSSQTDLNGDIPMILTSKQVQVGKREVAQEVQLDGQPGSAHRLGVDTAVQGHGPASAGGSMTRSPASFRSIASSTGSDPFDESKAVKGGGGGFDSPRSLQHATSHATFGEAGYDPARSERSLTPASQDLRFSMGSLAFRGDRDSISTQGTGNVVVGEARKVFVGGGGASQLPRQGSSLHPPRAPFSQPSAGPRESMMSGRSDADSLLGSFPIIPPSPDGDDTTFAAPTLPTSMSSGSVLAPAILSRPGGNISNLPSRPTSDTTSINHEGLLSAFPPVPGPRQARQQEDREEALVDGADRGGSGRSTRGLSVASEGLSAFDFQFGGDEEDVPPVPAIDQRGRV